MAMRKRIQKMTGENNMVSREVKAICRTVGLESTKSPRTKLMMAYSADRYNNTAMPESMAENCHLPCLKSGWMPCMR